MVSVSFIIVVAASLVLRGCQASDTTTTAGITTKGLPGIKAEPNDGVKRGKNRPTTSDLIALCGGIFVLVLALTSVAALMWYKKRGDRMIRKLEKENDLEEARLDEEDRLEKVEFELINRDQQERERKQHLINHGGEIK